jgi:uncharacterized damage-inducible protein DinB
MTSREFFIWTLKDEMPRFDRVFKALKDVPKEKWQYRPDPRSRSTEELVQHTFGSEAATFPIFLESGKLDGSDFQKIMAKDANEAVERFNKDLERTVETAEKISEEDWDSKSVMTMGEQTIWESKKGEMAWSLLLDLIHHRGQLSTYLRPMGGRVPSIYGPSGDDAGE